MKRPLGVALFALLLSCGDDREGAASVHGHLFQGQGVLDTSFEFVARAEVHGAGPFRIVVTDTKASGASKSATDPNGVAPGRTINIVQPVLPPKSGRIELAPDQGITATVQSFQDTGVERTGGAVGNDFLFSDGSFVLHPVSGFFELQLQGRQPGDGVTGRFELHTAQGDTLTGTFAAALSD